jgi:hypothetical protein
MAFRLRHDYSFTDEKTGKLHKGTSYHVSADGFVIGHSDPKCAKIFKTEKEAFAYLSKHLRGRGYNPEPINETA